MSRSPAARSSLRALTGLQALAAAALLSSFAAATPAVAATYQIDPVHSSILFKVKHLGTANFYGRFNDMSGGIDIDAANPGAGKVRLEIKTASVDTRVQQRDDHLRSPDFFDAKQFPTITFQSTKVVAVDDDSFDVTGDLSLHGVTKPVTLRVEKTGSGKHPRSGAEMIGFETKTTVKRSDFGMQFMQGPLSDEVEILISVEAAAAP
jgi:polyisoprenoid-binding protein YceI